jgi:uncharacterized Zn-finger protein
MKKRHGNYKTGKYCTPHYCKDCGTLIDWMGRSVRCYHCDIVFKYKTGIWNKKGDNNPMAGRHHKKSTRIQQSLSAGGNGNPGENSEYPLSFYRIREKILKRDNYECQICNKEGTDVHHIDYNKQNSNKKNLITLCGDHNTKANYNKPFWIEYLKSKIKNA